MRGLALTAVLASLLAGAPRAAAQTGPNAGMINLSCVEALAATGRTDLAGIFSFVAEKDSHAAFGDLLARDPKTMKKFLAKLDKDLRKAGGISVWDQQVLLFVGTIYASPLAETLPKPSSKVSDKIAKLSAAKTMTLEELTARRRS